MTVRALVMGDSVPCYGTLEIVGLLLLLLLLILLFYNSTEISKHTLALQRLYTSDIVIWSRDMVHNQSHREEN